MREEHKNCTASFKKTVIKVEVISDGDWKWDNLSDVAHAISNGGCSGSVEEDHVEFLSEEDTARALIKQGSDPSFLLGEGWEGRDIISEDKQNADKVEKLVKIWEKRGYTELHRFPHEYVLLVHPVTLHKVRIYENGEVWRLGARGDYVKLPDENEN